MAKIDLSSHASTIGVLLFLDTVMLFAVLYAYHVQPAMPPDLLSLLRDAFMGWNGALALALTGGSRALANPRPADSSK